MAGTVRFVPLAVALLLTLPLTLAQAPDEASAACPAGMETMQGVGLVCPRGDGFYEVFNAALEPLGTIHGTDPAPAGPASAADDPLTPAAGTSVSCVSGAAGTYFIQVIYARAFDDVNQYAALAGPIRTLTGNATKLVDDAAIATGGTASLRVKCVSGVVEVLHVALPTAKASASFSTIVTDLRNAGYNDGKVKYWVYYDDSGACTCGGTGHVYNDDSPGATNLNNGNGVSFFAVNFGYIASTRIWMHELGHNLGAVQNSAPHSTLALHCYDGRDTMCYNDGGTNGSLYSTGYCATEVFDCGKNDYFHRSPPAGSYLATKWNLGNAVIRYIEFGVPTLTSLSCSPSSYEIGTSTTCSFMATDDGTVRYTVSWGDSTTTVIPSPSTFTTPGVTQSASKTYSMTGTKTITVSVVDNVGNAGNTLSTIVTVNPAVPPTMDLLTCTPPSPTETGMSVPCSFRASDTSTGVRYNVDWGDSSSSTVPPSGDVAPGVTQSASHAYATAGTRTISVTATDTTGLTSGPLTWSVSVIAAVPPTIASFTCSPATVQTGASAACSFRATDTSSGVRYVVAWGDSTSATVPASGFATPGVTRSASHAWASAGTKSVTLTVEDDTGLTASATRTVTVVDDVTPPTLTVTDPNGGTLYRGCATRVNTLTGPAVWALTACVRASATDDRSGVAKVEVFVNGFLRGTDTAAPYDFEFPVPGNDNDASVRVVATDGVGNIREVFRTVAMLDA